jgi:hypothetical protein
MGLCVCVSQILLQGVEEIGDRAGWKPNLSA